MGDRVLVFLDHTNGSVLPVSWEVLGVGRKLADELGSSLVAIVVGHEIAKLAEESIQYGADIAIAADDVLWSDFRPETHASAVSKAVQAASTDVLLAPNSSRGREVAAMVAVDLGTGVAPDVIDLEISEGAILATRPIYAGKLLSKVICKERRPQILTLRSRAFSKPEADPGRSGEIVAQSAEGLEAKTSVTGYRQSEGGVSLADAAVVVAGGRGVSNHPGLTPPDEITDEKDKEIWRAEQGFELLRDLAQVLGGALGASRAAVDAGYIPYQYQVGQTGKVVSPDLYIAVGISGAIQHLAGMRTAKTIIAINKDGDAPIFKLARFGIAGDLFEILPALTAKLKEKLGK
jgi:electron transfer flavoprotein alpha subunit